MSPTSRGARCATLLVAQALAVFGGMGSSPASAQLRDRATLVAALDSAARAHVADELVAGASVAVVRGLDTLLLRGYGFADVEWDVPTPPDATASYEIGSVTKQFTAAAVLKLVEEGRIDLDADVTEYLPDFDTRGHPVPVRRLLDHTSGIQGYTEMSAFGDLMRDPLPRDSLVSMVEAQPFLFEPGTGQIYNNSAFFLLGLIIEEVSGDSYEDFVHSELFEPVGMDGSYYCSTSEIRPRRAHGYDAGPDGLQRKAYLDHTWPYAAGSLCSTAGDLVKWNQALHGGRVLSDASYRAMTTPMPLLDGTELEYAMGLGVGLRGDVPVISHSGGINGFLSDGRYYPDQQLVVVVLQNSAGPRGPGALSATLVDLLLGPAPEPEAIPFDGDLQPLLGEYAGPQRSGHTHVTVSRDGDQLVLTPRGADDGTRLAYVGDGVWRAGGTRFSFDVADGRATALRVYQGSARNTLTRIPRIP